MALPLVKKGYWKGISLKVYKTVIFHRADKVARFLEIYDRKFCFIHKGNIAHLIFCERIGYSGFYRASFDFYPEIQCFWPSMWTCYSDIFPPHFISPKKTSELLMAGIHGLFRDETIYCCEWKVDSFLSIPHHFLILFFVVRYCAR